MRASFSIPGTLRLTAPVAGYVADSDNSQIQIFSEGGQYLWHFGRKGKRNSEIADCTSNAIESNIVYIGDGVNHRVSLFTTD